MEEKIYVTKASMPPYEEFVEAIKPLWDSHMLTNMGKYHEQFRAKLQEYLNVPVFALFTNGHMALELTLQALELSGEVITTPFTFASTTHAIVRNNLTPVFCDIREDNYTMDADKIEELITDKTTAIVPVHVYGTPCDVDKIEAIAAKHHLRVVYDAAHAFGVQMGERSIFSYGDASMASFHATKAFNTIEGGGCAINDSSIVRKVYQLENFGIMGETSVGGVGANAKMNEFQAIMGLCNLNYFEENRQKREKLVKRYCDNLASVEGIRLLPGYLHGSEAQGKDVILNYTYFPVVFEPQKFGHTRNEVYNFLKMHNIYARKYFYPLTSKFECYENRDFRGETPVAERISEQVLTLPLYADLEPEQVDRICELILSMKNRRGKQ